MGDFGIDSVGSLILMIYLLEVEVESVICLSNFRVDILNLIYENDIEIFDLS